MTTTLQSRCSAPALLAGVLAGGRSRRMGRCKAAMPHPAGGTWLEHVVRVASRVAGEVVLLGSASELPPALQSLPVLADPVPDAGPLAGLCSLLAAAGGRWALLLACDLPGLQAAVLQPLIQAAGPDRDAVVYTCRQRPDRYHACCGLYHPRGLDAARTALAGADHSLHGLLRTLRTLALLPDPAHQDQLRNVNTPHSPTATADQLFND